MPGGHCYLRSALPTLGAPKVPLILPPADAYGGDLVIADIGIPASVIDNLADLQALRTALRGDVADMLSWFGPIPTLQLRDGTLSLYASVFQNRTVLEPTEINLFAADPLLAKPIQMNFDPAGRLWVATSEVYPQIKPGQKANDKIQIL